MPGDANGRVDEYDRPGAERSADGLKRIVRYQRWLIAVVLAQLGAVGADLSHWWRGATGA